MPDYHSSAIRPTDRRAVEQLHALLAREGIALDRNLDYTAGLYDEEYQLVATGSCFGNTLRCMAVDSRHRGEGLMNRMVSELAEYQFARGNTELFLYTKLDTAPTFADMGFYEVARVEGRVVFMENRKSGFADYLARVREETASAGLPADGRHGAVVMNANPFTLGHQYLLERAAEDCDVLHVFVVSEDASLVPFSVREALVRAGSAHIPHVICHRTGSYMVSAATFPSYFLRDEETVIHAHAELDIAVFVAIARALGIGHRFVGEEPASIVTGIYNRVMEHGLAQAGIAYTVLERRQADGAPISASTVRACIKNGDWDALARLVPRTTLDYFRSLAAEAVIARIRESEDVVHY